MKFNLIEMEKAAPLSAKQDICNFFERMLIEQLI